jgi:hypothetical protein
MENITCISCNKDTIDPTDGICTNSECLDITANLDAAEDEQFLN